MKVWVLTGFSSSSDHYGPLVFTRKPSEELLKKIAHYWDGDEDESGQGDYGSYVDLTLTEVEVNQWK